MNFELNFRSVSCPFAIKPPPPLLPISSPERFSSSPPPPSSSGRTATSPCSGISATSLRMQPASRSANFHTATSHSPTRLSLSSLRPLSSSSSDASFSTTISTPPSLPPLPRCSPGASCSACSPPRRCPRASPLSCSPRRSSSSAPAASFPIRSTTPIAPSVSSFAPGCYCVWSLSTFLHSRPISAESCSSFRSSSSRTPDSPFSSAPWSASPGSRSANRRVALLLAGAATGFAFALALIQCTVGLANYLHWTIQFAASRRLPGLSTMLGVYRDSALLWIYLVFALGLALFLLSPRPLAPLDRLRSARSAIPLGLCRAVSAIRFLRPRRSPSPPLARAADGIAWLRLVDLPARHNHRATASPHPPRSHPRSLPFAAALGLNLRPLAPAHDPHRDYPCRPCSGQPSYQAARE